MAKDIPYCPLMSAGSDIDKVCTLESCAWFVPSVRKCSMYMLAYMHCLIQQQDKKLQNSQIRFQYENYRLH